VKPRGRSYEILVNASTLLFVLFDYTTCFFVRSQSDELRVSQMVAFGPLQEFDLRHEFRPEPNALFHVIGGQALAPT